MRHPGGAGSAPQFFQSCQKTTQPPARIFDTNSLTSPFAPLAPQFGVIMADPPWDIHMELPYGTMADDEMRNLNVPVLQDDGLIFLWVTGRAMELGREW